MSIIYPLAKFVLLAAIFAAATSVNAGGIGALEGHGGPVMGIDVDAQSQRVATASFDNAVGLWQDGKPRWLDAHDAAVNVVRFLGPSHLASAGDDNAVILWRVEKGTHTRLAGHTAKIMDLAVDSEQAIIASASWDNRIGLWDFDGNSLGYLSGHTAGVNDVAFSRDGKSLYSASVDGTIRKWDLATNREIRVLVRNGFGVNVIALGGGRNDAEEWLAYGTLDGATRVVDLDSGSQIQDFTFDRRPILAIAVDASGKKLATGDGHGFITIVDTGSWQIEKDFRAALRGPIWALAFSVDGNILYAGGIDDVVNSWPIDNLAEYKPTLKKTPQFLRDPASMSNGERQFARKCSICHSLDASSDRKAGPTLRGLFGRLAGTVDGYNYSNTLVASEIVWNEKTVDRLFAEGPEHFIPGSKMPMQRIAGRQDRKDLIDFLKQKTMQEINSEIEN